MEPDDITDLLPWSGRPVWRSVDCGPGWYRIILKLDAHLKNIDPGYRVVQVKEKFGGLRYYTEGLPVDEATRQAFSQAISQAEAESMSTCEVCGEAGTLGGTGWIRTLCEKCRNETMRKRNAV